MIYPADNPTVAVFSGHGIRIRIDKEAIISPGKIRILCENPDEFASGKKILKAPNNTIIEIDEINPPVVLPTTKHSFVVRNKRGNLTTPNGPRIILDCGNRSGGLRADVNKGDTIGIVGAAGQAVQSFSGGNDSRLSTQICSVATEDHNQGAQYNGAELVFKVHSTVGGRSRPILTLNHESGSLFTGSISQKAGPIRLPAIGEAFDGGTLDYGTRATDLAYMDSASKIGHNLRNYETETGNIFLSSSIGTDGDLCPILFKTPSRNTLVECNITFTFFDQDKNPFNTLQSSSKKNYNLNVKMKDVESIAQQEISKTFK